MKRLKYLAPILLILAVAGFYLWRLGLPVTPKTLVRTYPELSNPKTVSLTCDYHGSKLKIDETLYGSLADYYQSEPKKYISYYKNDNKAFVFNYEQDKTLEELTSKIQALAVEENLNKDQTVDLAACFIQSIPYDQAKAEKILSDQPSQISEIIPRYPYETLYDFTGVCTDKSYLGSAILTRLGYGNSLLSFDSQRHLSLGVAVPTGYGQLGTDYAILELTNMGFLVGDIPQIKNNIGLAENTIDNLPEISSENVTDPKNDLTELSSANRVEKVASGLSYMRIAERVETRKEIEALSAKINEKLEEVKLAQAKLDEVESRVKQAEEIYKSERTKESYDVYSQTYSQYQQVLRQTNAVIADYNATVKKFNQLVEYYKSF